MKELADLLKLERTNRGLSLEAVSKQSGLSVDMLASLEACDFERFGAPLLIRNTIRTYCRVLLIDADPLIERFSSEIASYNIQDAGIKNYGQQMKLLRKKRRMIGLPFLLLFLLSAGTYFGGAWISEKRSRLSAPPDAYRAFIQEELPVELQQSSSLPPPSVRTEKSEADLRKADEAIREAEIHIKESETAAQLSGDQGKMPGKGFDGQDSEARGRITFSNSATEALAGVQPVPNIETGSSQRFAVEADSEVWIQVKIDDRQTLSVMLHPGERRQWQAEEFLNVVIGNAGGVRMTWNDLPIKAPRETGRVLRFRLPDYAALE